MILLFNLIGLVLVALIIWWFWISQSNATSVTSNRIKIEVQDGVYTPSRVKVNARQHILLEFIRKDSSPCSEYVIFETLGKQAQLPFNKAIKVDLGNLKPGIYPFSCQMKMYTGELIVK